MNLTHTINLVEAAWTLASLVGLILRVRNLGEAIVDRAVVTEHEPVDPVLDVLTKQSIRSEATGAVVKALFVTIGIWAMAVPEPVHQPNQTLGVVAGVGLVIAVVLLDLNSWGWSTARRAAMSHHPNHH